MNFTSTLKYAICESNPKNQIIFEICLNQKIATIGIYHWIANEKMLLNEVLNLSSCDVKLYLFRNNFNVMEEVIEDGYSFPLDHKSEFFFSS